LEVAREAGVRTAAMAEAMGVVATVAARVAATVVVGVAGTVRPTEAGTEAARAMARAAGAIIPDVALIPVTILVISARQARVEASASAIFPRGRWELLKVSVARTGCS